MATPLTTADDIRARYKVRAQLTPDRELALEELAERRVRSLLRRVVADDAVHDKPNKLLQEKENYRIYEVPSDDKATVTLKGVLLLQSSSCEEVMELLSATGAADVRTLYSDLFGSLFTDCAVLHETSGGAASTSSRSSKSRHNGGRTDSTASSITPLQTSAAYHWLMLRDLSSHLPQRDFFFLRYNQTHAPDDPVASHRVGWGASVWESVELPTCEPLLSSALCRRHAFSKCGFIVEASEQSDATRVTFFLQSAADDRPWLLKAAASVRFIPSAIVNLRIRHNRFIDKRAWSSTDDCALCAQSFKLFKRQHHCRICGVSVCSKCSDVRQNAIRVCLSCLNGEDTSALWGRVHMGRKKLGASSSSVGSSSSLSYSHSWDTTVKESWTSSASSFSQSMDPTMSASVSSARVSLQSSESFSSCARASALDEFLEGDAFSTLKLKSSASMASMSSATSASGDEDDVTENTPFAYPLTYSKGNAWPDAPRPSNEDARLARLQSLNLTQQFAKDNLQELLDLAKTSSNCPVAAVTVVTVSQSLLVAAMGLAGDHVPRDIAFEAHVIMSAEPLVVLDTQKDERFAMNPLVSTLHIRSYIGLPLVTKEGVVVGALSLGDVKTRDKVTGAELRSLQRIASRLVAKMDANNLETSHEVSGVMLL